MSRQVELKFQTHLINSYENSGGHARKWASEWQNGVPDLVATLPNVGLHLVEVKHRPDFNLRVDSDLANPMDKIQQHAAAEYMRGGGWVLLCVIGCNTNAIGSDAYWFSPMTKRINVDSCLLQCRYKAGVGYPLHDLPETIKGLWKVRT